MNTPPKRTGASPLSDDELLLFDFMSCVNVPLKCMRAEDYRIHMNVGYTHSLSDCELSVVLGDLIRRGWVVAREREGETTWFGLTAKGGELWEAERRPDWSLYVQDVSGRMGALFVFSPSCATAERFVAIAQSIQWFDFSRARVRYRRLRHYLLIPWKQFLCTHLLVVKKVRESWDIDWDAYESHRTWWRDISELDTLDWERIRRLPSAP